MVLSSLSGIGRLAMILVLTFLWVGNLGVFSAFFFLLPGHLLERAFSGFSDERQGASVRTAKTRNELERAVQSAMLKGEKRWRPPARIVESESDPRFTGSLFLVLSRFSPALAFVAVYGGFPGLESGQLLLRVFLRRTYISLCTAIGAACFYYLLAAGLYSRLCLVASKDEDGYWFNSCTR